MLRYDTKRRSTAIDCLRHSWLQNEIECSYERKKKNDTRTEPNRENEFCSIDSRENENNSRQTHDNHNRTSPSKSKFSNEKSSSQFHAELKSKIYLDSVKNISENEDANETSNITSPSKIINLERLKSQDKGQNNDDCK